MKGKVGSAEFVISDGAARQWSARMDWMSEPLCRANAMFDELWQWLDVNSLASWDEVWAARRHCHPMPQIDPDDGKTDPLARGIGGMFFSSMERGEMDLKLIQGTMPTLWDRLPKRKRDSGVPTAFLEAVLFLSALLACGEYAELGRAMKRDPVDREMIAMHLYWFQRFYALWSFTVASKPSNLQANAERRKKTAERREELKKFCGSYMQRNRKATPRSAVIAFLAPEGAEHSEFDGLYRWACKNLASKATIKR